MKASDAVYFKKVIIKEVIDLYQENVFNVVPTEEKLIKFI